MKMQTKLKTQQQEEYKETELGLLPKDWEVVKIIDLVDFQRGTEVGSNNYNKEGRGIRFLRVVDVSGKRNEVIYTTSENIKKCNEKDVLITFDGSPGIVRKGLSGAYSSGIRKVVIKNERILLDFIYFMAMTHFVQKIIEKYSTGVTIKHASKSIPHIKIPLPPIPEQKSIAYVLSTIQTAKEKTEQVIQATKELKKSLMKHLFTYGPVSLEEAEKVKLKKTEIGGIPEDWKVVRLKKLANKITDGAHRTPTYVEEGVPFLRVTDIQTPFIDWAKTKYIPLKEHQELIKRCKPEKGDILLSKNGTIGLTKVIDWDKEFSIFVSLCLIKPKHELINNYYLAYYLGSNGLEQIKLRGKKMTVTNLHLVEIKELLVPFPPLPTQQKIASILSAVDEKIRAEENKKKALDELFKSMLHNLMTAKIRVKDLSVGVENE